MKKLSSSVVFVVAMLALFSANSFADLDEAEETADDLAAGGSHRTINKNVRDDSTKSAESSDLYAKITELEERLRELTGQLQHTEHAHKKALEKINNIAADFNYRLMQMEEKKGKKEVSTNVVIEPKRNFTRSKRDSIQEQPNEINTTDKFSKMIKEGNYQSAVSGLKQFIKTNSDEDLDEPYFLLGKAYSAQNMHDKAGVYFLKCYKNYPKKPRAAESLLSLASSLVKLEKYNRACSILSRLEHEYPNISAEEKKLSNSLRAKLKCDIAS